MEIIHHIIDSVPSYSDLFDVSSWNRALTEPHESPAINLLLTRLDLMKTADVDINQSVST